MYNSENIFFVIAMLDIGLGIVLFFFSCIFHISNLTGFLSFLGIHVVFKSVSIF